MGCLSATITLQREPLKATCSVVCDTAKFAELEAPDLIYISAMVDQNAKMRSNTSWAMDLNQY